MLSRIGTAWRSLRRALNRSEWLTRLLGLEVAQEQPRHSGLVMIQVDGLGHDEAHKALEGRELPFLKRLIDKEHYEFRRMYAGVPSSTAVVQAELFYGVRQAVPGFSFRDHDSGELVTMIDSDVAAKVEREAGHRYGDGLLDGGSGYANNYTGGAEEPHFCPNAPGWGSGLRSASPLAVLAFLVTNIFSFLRMAALAGVEAVLAVVDLVRGVIAGKSFFQELKFIPTRIAITVLLRELAVIGAKIDIARGLPVVHVNFLGYDEQSHRRGPNSRFAHWTLKGIDRAIRRLWKATQLSHRRHYELWVYSDHGQEAVTPYVKQFGRSFEEAVADVFSRHAGRELPYRSGSPWGAQLHRAGHLGTRFIHWLLPGEKDDETDGHGTELAIAALGPVAMIYWNEDLEDPARLALARRLVEDAEAPAVLFRNRDGAVGGWMDGRPLRLPEDGAAVVGADHPFLDETVADLVQLCHHEDAGDFVALGQAGASPNLSFALENGAHGGTGRAETSAFSLVPRDIEFTPPSGQRMYVRDLREAALHLRGRASHEIFSAGAAKNSESRVLRLVTYNVHSCVGMDGRFSTQRIARVIARCEADVVCLQELDMNRPRSGGIDQAHLIAKALDMDFHFHPALKVEEELYGDAVLTRLPMKLVKAASLPHSRTRPRVEPRGAIWVEVTVGDVPVQVINTHLGVFARDRNPQIAALLGPEWLAHPECRSPVVLCGDFNALPRSHVHRQASRRLHDVQEVLDAHRPKATFSGRLPTARIDHIFVDSGVEVVSVEVPNNALNRVASDHLPVIAELRFSPDA